MKKSDAPTEDAGAQPAGQEPVVQIPTMTYAFNQGLQYAAILAQSAGTLDQLRTHLTALAADTQSLVDAIVHGEEAVVARVRAGLPAATPQVSPQQAAAQAAATAVGAP